MFRSYSYCNESKLIGQVVTPIDMTSALHTEMFIASVLKYRFICICILNKEITISYVLIWEVINSKY